MWLEADLETYREALTESTPDEAGLRQPDRSAVPERQLYPVLVFLSVPGEHTSSPKQGSFLHRELPQDIDFTDTSPSQSLSSSTEVARKLQGAGIAQLQAAQLSKLTKTLRHI